MKIHSPIPILVAGATVLAIGAALTAAPAMAAPGCTGASCSEGASVIVAASITESVSPSAFTFGGGNPVAAGATTGPTQQGNAQQCPGAIDAGPPAPSTGLCADYSVTVATGDSAGFVLTASAPDLSNTRNTIPVGALSVGALDGNGRAASFKPLTNAAATLITNGAATPVAGMAFPFADSLVIPSGASGDYSTSITYSAIAS